MRERDIAEAVLKHYGSRAGYLVTYNTDGHYGQIGQFTKHNIRIGDRYPDILVLTPADRVLAVEVKKKDGNLAEALGQALLYRDGTPLTYVALDTSDANKIRDRALAAGIGVISVGGSEVIKEDPPPLAYVATLQNDLLRELRMLLRRQGPSLRLTAMQLNHPLHYLAPILRSPYPSPLGDLKNWLSASQSWGLESGAVNHAIRGAQALNIIEVMDSTVQLGTTGRFLQSMLHHSGYSWTHHKIRSLTSNGVLYEQEPFLAGLVRIAMQENEDIRMLLEALRHRSTDTMISLLHILSYSYPNAFLNIFVRLQFHESVIKLILTKDFSRLLEPTYVREWLNSFVRFQLKRQLQHAGFLAHGPGGLALHDKRSVYDPQTDVWRPQDPYMSGLDSVTFPSSEVAATKTT